ncbi:ABC transporter substrate-binding protein, partial [Escherichia coli]|nr:ABC transporter substrate-binding protein [Escherichia coli]
MAADRSTGEPSPALAESWVVADDRRSVTFTLREDVTFHDGTEFDAAAVKANFDKWQA